MRDVVDAAIEPHCDRPDRIVINGQNARLSAQQATGLSLAIHELATNALQYGALSSEQGQVQLAWSIAPDRLFTFKWTERGGPRVHLPDGKGFGSQLTTQVVPAYFAGEAIIDFHPEGLVYKLSGQLAGDDCENDMRRGQL